MQLKVWILLAALLAVAYAAVEPLQLELEAEEPQDPSAEHARPKRFLVKKAILAKKALAVGGAVGLAGGLLKGKLLSSHGGGWYGGHGGWHGGHGWDGGHDRTIIVHAHPVYHGGWHSGDDHGGWGWQPHYAPSHGWNSGAGSNAWAGSGGGWSGAKSNAWAGGGWSGAGSSAWAGSGGGGWSGANSNAWAGSNSWD